MNETRALKEIEVQRVCKEPAPMVTSDGNDLIEKRSGLISEDRAAGVPVVYVQHRSEDQLDDPDLVGVHPRLARKATDPIVEKRFGIAFFRTTMEARLSDLGLKTLCGAG